MKEILSFIHKEFLHIFRDKRTMLIVLVMPVVQILLFGFAISTEVNNATVDIVGNPNDASVRKLALKMEHNNSLSLGRFLDTPQEAELRMKKGRAKAAVLFGSEYDRENNSAAGATVRVVCDGSDPNTAQMVGNYVQAILQEGSSSPVPSPSVQLVYNPSMNSSYNFVPGVMGLILMLICSMMTAVSIVREKEFGTLELVLVSPVRPAWIVISKLIPYLVISIFNFITIMLLARFVMDVPMNGSFALLCLTSLIFVGASLGLGLLISTISTTQQTAMLICGMGLTMPTMMLAGIIFPCESMPLALQFLSDIIPAKWYIIMVKKIMIQGAGFGSIVPEFLILTSMMVFLLWFSVKKFRTRLK